MKKVKFPRMLRNSIIGIVSSIVSTVATYVIRIIISRALGDEIYGVNSIFISIVSAILILELGMSTAMIIVLYRPVIDDDREKIKSIICFFKKFYRYFCLLLFSIGLVVAFFLLGQFVNTSLNFTNVRLYFLLYLLAIIFKYLWSYKSCLLYANKENSVVSVITIINTVAFTAAEAICVLVFKNYWLYLILFMAQNVCLNVIVNCYVNKHYPFITEKNITPLPKDDKRNLVSIIKPMFIQRLANQIQDSSSVIILGIIGISAISVGYFSNYIMLVHACQTFFNQIGASFTTSYGNYAAKIEDNNLRYSYYLTSRFYMSWVAIVFSSMYLCLIQPFISLFFGSSYCLSLHIVILLTFYIFIILNSSINLSTQNAVGEHKLDSAYMVVQAVSGIASSVLLGIWIGSIGVVLGMLLSVTAFTGVIKGCKVAKYIFGQKSISHILLLAKEAVIFIVVAGGCFALNYFVIKPEGILLFILSAVVTFIVSNVSLIIIYIRSEKLTIMKNLVFCNI